MLSIGLLGCGNIGQIIAGYKGTWKIVALYDKVHERARELSLISGGIPYENFDEFVRAPFDLVVEAASVKAVRMYAATILIHDKHLVVMSVGALSDPLFREEIITVARGQKKKIHVPSGAIAGLDNIKVGQIAPISRLLLRTTKSPSSLGIPASERMLVFKGKANECIKEFPRNVNVSVALSLASGRDVDVELYVDPAVDRNIHEIFVEGVFGDIYIRVNNLPSPDNPATSYLAALSILSLLNNLEEPLVVGT
ncbi:MAG: aspartate dehydrogenase [Methanoregulaceae archaeon]|nr:aspartate dehydrogenase [Methanoregulaceae archaeon]MCU0629268.1 aspartate dehydrogenase [Methanoregulaceae archaeon]